MKIAFCTCGREHHWFNGDTALCPCGKLVDPQTRREFFEAKRNHLATVALIVEQNPGLIRLKESS